MVRKAALILALGAAFPASAQSSTTNCQRDYFGNLSCQTQQNSGIDWSLANQGKVLQSGANAVPNYAEQQLKRREMELRERELRLKEQALRQAESPPQAAKPVTAADGNGKYGLASGMRGYIDLLIQYCRTGAPIADVPDDKREIAGALCYAYDQGRIAEIVGDKR